MAKRGSLTEVWDSPGGRGVKRDGGKRRQDKKATERSHLATENTARMATEVLFLKRQRALSPVDGGVCEPQIFPPTHRPQWRGST